MKPSNSRMVEEKEENDGGVEESVKRVEEEEKIRSGEWSDSF